MRQKGQKAPMYQRKEESKNIIQFDNNGYPSCENHGAMNCVSETRKLWRCLTCGVGVSFGNVESFDRWLVANNIKNSEEKDIYRIIIISANKDAESYKKSAAIEVFTTGSEINKTILDMVNNNYQKFIDANKGVTEGTNALFKIAIEEPTRYWYVDIEATYTSQKVQMLKPH